MATDSLDAAFYFSAEEYVMGGVFPGEPVMMVWRTKPTVMLGRYQVALAETDMDYIKAAGLQLVRRSSGGGAIFTDLGTIQYSLILDSAEGPLSLQKARDTVSGHIVSALAELGVQARTKGRNDIEVEGHKVSGMAQYAIRNRICTHASLLYDADLGMLARALRPDEEKIQSKGVRSVQSRVINIKEYIHNPVPALAFIGSFCHFLQKTLLAREYTLTDGDLSRIRRIQRDKYGNPRWTLGSSPLYTVHAAKRFPGGKADIFLEIQKERVTACSIRGDFMGTVPIEGLEKRLEGLAYERSTFEAALSAVFLEPYVGSLSKDQLLESIFGS